MTIAAPAIASTIGDEERRRGLRRMRTVAVSLLLLAAVVYVVTLDHEGALGYVHAASEAAMVGAIADWFAVTALFRHPLGIPIPHTALIPTRKATLARSLQEFVTQNFLSAAVVRDKVMRAEPSRRLGHWLATPQHSRRVADEAAILVRMGLERVKDEDIEAFLTNEVLPKLVDEPLAAVAGQLLGDVVDEGAHHGLVDLALTEARIWLVDNEQTFGDVLRTRAPWWTPQWVDDKVVGRLHHEALAWVTDIIDDPQHHARQALDDFLRRSADDLQNDPETQASAERLKARLLGHPQVAESATSLWGALSRTLQVSLADPDGTIRERACQRLAELGQRLTDDDALASRCDSYAADATGFVVERYGREITTVITDTIEGWDGAEAARRIELHVGRDLQFIRINGTIVGGLAGLAIHALTQLA
jgi:uncharacterized membrane-anchored protein YjiN (DUF445 family)